MATNPSATPVAFFSIPLPEFELRQDVWLHYAGSSIPTYIRHRLYSPDKHCWYYRVKLSGRWHKAHELSDRVEAIDLEGLDNG